MTQRRVSVFLYVCFSILFSNGLTGQNENVQRIGKLYYADGLSDIWGYTDSAGTDYALVGVKSGVSIVDITTTPSKPKELFKVEGPFTNWWDIKTWNDYAYVVNESDSGLLIINLHYLPDSVSWHWWTADTFQLKSAHNIFIDEKGVAYLFGSNVSSRVTFVIDVNQNPEKPEILGMYAGAYVHDGFVRHDTLWAGELHVGQMNVIDMKDKQNPKPIAAVTTPDAFTHNVWLNDSNTVAFTTDERIGGFITAYDVNDLSNIYELGRYQSHPGMDGIPHNTFWRNGFLINSYYRDGITIVDAKRPHNLIQTGNYDTSPLPSGPGFEGCWGVYPFFKSGLIVASDRFEGLFVLKPDYVRACYLEGTITDDKTGFPVFNATIEILGEDVKTYSNLKGEFATGIIKAGRYDIKVTSPFCQTKIYSGIELRNDSLTKLNIALNCLQTGIEGPIENATLKWHFTNQSLIIESQNPIDDIQIFTISGKSIMHLKNLESTRHEIQIPEAHVSGIYIVNISTGNQNFSFKIPVF
jgi:choice-of-anchor B domain-containing protein